MVKEQQIFDYEQEIPSNGASVPKNEVDVSVSYLLVEAGVALTR